QVMNDAVTHMPSHALSSPAPGTCVYCGLPVPQSWWSRKPASANGGWHALRYSEGRAGAGEDRTPFVPQGVPPVEEYCCFGCRFAASVTQARGEQGQVNWVLTRLGVAIFLSMNVMVFTMALWTHDLYEAEGTGGALGTSVQGLFRYLSLLFALP